MDTMVEKNLAVYEPPKQTRSVLIHWRLPEEWAEVLYDWVCVFFVFVFWFSDCLWVSGGFDGTAEYHPNVFGYNRSSSRIFVDEYPNPSLAQSHLDPW
jgi:hypothetical protein